MKFAFRKILEFISNFRKTCPIVFWLTAISFILAIVPFLYCIIAFFLPNKLIGTWLFFIPFLIIFIISFLSFFAYRKFPLLTNIMVIPVIICIIIFIQCFMSLIVFSWLFCANEEYKFDKPEYYEEIMEHFEQDRVAHFPKHIPKNAKNIEINGSYLSFFGSRNVFIKFDIDKQYINKELKKYKFVKISKPDSYAFAYVFNHANIDINNYNIYIISGELSRRGDCCGIGIDENKMQIVYFYLDPD